MKKRRASDALEDESRPSKGKKKASNARKFFRSDLMGKPVLKPKPMLKPSRLVTPLGSVSLTEERVADIATLVVTAQAVENMEYVGQQVDGAHFDRA